jgi:hypothetical protein
MTLQIVGVLSVLAALAALLVGVGLLYHVGVTGGRAYVSFRGQRVVTCPETLQPAGVEVDATHAALTAYRGRLDLRLRTCSRWPERESCGQECLRQIEAAPAECLVRTMLNAFYLGERCAFCGKPFGTIHWHDHKPGLVSPQGRTTEWHEVAAEELPKVLETHRPVCWNCHVAETFRREHPELVVERPEKGDHGRPQA